MINAPWFGNDTDDQLQKLPVALLELETGDFF